MIEVSCFRFQSYGVLNVMIRRFRNGVSTAISPRIYGITWYCCRAFCRYDVATLGHYCSVLLLPTVSSAYVPYCSRALSEPLSGYIANRTVSAAGGRWNLIIFHHFVLRCSAPDSRGWRGVHKVTDGSSTMAISPVSISARLIITA